MLARPGKHRCIECGKPFGAEGFACYYGILEYGPAYWSDRGILCSVDCSLAHQRQRMEDGSLPDRPADPPFNVADLLASLPKV